MSSEASNEVNRLLLRDGFPPPALAWINSLVDGQRQPMPAILAHVKSALLATDWSTPGVIQTRPETNFPAQLIGPGAESIQEFQLTRPIAVQVLDVQNMSLSRWQQVQALEAIERGEQKRGREIIRVVNDAEGEETDSSSTNTARNPAPTHAGPPDTNATHRLVLQDPAGNKMFAMELVRIPRIGIGRLRIGEKLILKAGTPVARGIILLDPSKVEFLGGVIEEMNKDWLKGRLARLRDEAQAGSSS